MVSLLGRVFTNLAYSPKVLSPRRRIGPRRRAATSGIFAGVMRTPTACRTISRRASNSAGVMLGSIVGFMSELPEVAVVERDVRATVQTAEVGARRRDRLLARARSRAEAGLGRRARALEHRAQRRVHLGV